MDTQDIITSSEEIANMEQWYPSLAAEDRAELIKERQQRMSDHLDNMSSMLDEIKRWHLA